MKNKNSVLKFTNQRFAKKTLFALSIIILIIAFTYADSDNLDVDINMTNYDPVIYEIAFNQSSYNPTENSTTTVQVNFNVSDENGVGDLNDSRCRCEWDNASSFSAMTTDNLVWLNDTVCDVTPINITAQTYTCTFDFKYWYLNGTWVVRVYVDDNNGGAFVTRDENMTYNALVASHIDQDIVEFGVIESSDYSTNVTDENTPIIITNTGNQILDEINVSGADLVDDLALAPNIQVSRFFVDDMNITDAQQLSNNSQKIVGVSVPIEDAVSGGAEDNVSFWFSVPQTLESGTYSATWILYENI